MGRQPAVIQAAPEDANFLLDPANAAEPSYLYDKFVPISAALTGFILPVYGNFHKRRPLYSGIQFIAACTLLGGAIGCLIQWKNEKYWADRDAILRDYVRLHPEDFKPKERIVIGDMLKPWYPSR